MLPLVEQTEPPDYGALIAQATATTPDHWIEIISIKSRNGFDSFYRNVATSQIAVLKTNQMLVRVDVEGRQVFTANLEDTHPGLPDHVEDAI